MRRLNEQDWVLLRDENQSSLGKQSIYWALTSALRVCLWSYATLFLRVKAATGHYRICLTSLYEHPLAAVLCSRCDGEAALVFFCFFFNEVNRSITPCDICKMRKLLQIWRTNRCVREQQAVRKQVAPTHRQLALQQEDSPVILRVRYGVHASEHETGINTVLPINLEQISVRDAIFNIFPAAI